MYLVKSALSNVKNRNAIRKTWGYEKRFADVQIRTVFLLGSDVSSKSSVQANIDSENEKYHDIIQGDFIDISIRYGENGTNVIILYTGLTSIYHFFLHTAAQFLFLGLQNS